jgi:hypothetical protein
MTVMTDAYIETSSVNQALEQGVDGREIGELVRRQGYRPALGMHTIYELARTFLDARRHHRGRELFKVLRDIDGTIVPMTDMLLDSEVIKLRTGSAVLPFLDHDNQTATRYEIEKLAQGLTEKAIQFIQAREKERQTVEPEGNDAYLKQIRADRKQYRSIKTFGQALEHFKDNIPALIADALRGRVSQSEAVELSMRLDSFPCIRSVVRANLYLNFIVIRNLTSPGYDRVDDFRHVIDASYCGALVTNDGQLARTMNAINPEVQSISWSELS